MVLSIDIGSSMINIVEGECKRGIVNVRKAVTVQTPSVPTATAIFLI